MNNQGSGSSAKPLTNEGFSNKLMSNNHGHSSNGMFSQGSNSVSHGTGAGADQGHNSNAQSSNHGYSSNGMFSQGGGAGKGGAPKTDGPLDKGQYHHLEAKVLILSAANNTDFPTGCKCTEITTHSCQFCQEEARRPPL